LFEVKYWGQHHSIKYAAPRMAPHGSVVLFSGWISRKPAVEMSTLAAVDGAIEALARTLALELAPVRVNAITPGQIDTPLWRIASLGDRGAGPFRSRCRCPPGRARGNRR
jgi:NAD(P)-dependent dehydrogenase (short-subunit alcohol dehydrogenase family)